MREPAEFATGHVPTRPAARLTKGFAVLLVGVGVYVASQSIPHLVA